MRRAAAVAAMSDMLRWFKDAKGVVSIFDATNSTKERRKWIYETCRDAGIETLFVESLCDDEDIIMNNIREVKTTSPDYKGLDPDVAAQDFRTRIRNYELAYETIDDHEKDYTYVKLINVGSTVIINQIKDYLSSRLVYYVQNLHIKPRSIWLSRVSPPLQLRNPTDLRSTANPNIICLERLVVTRVCRLVVKHTRKPFPASSRSPESLPIRRLSSGPPRFIARF